ncbi:MAG: ABC transporter ATP-binding protein [Chloroflexi bacterium]|nr:ABC transporter ATP-binding protein [Chloroflexota bacterium]
MTEPCAVECRNLGKSFGDVCAVESVSFSLEPGRFMALLGPSGCGKTTVLRLIAGLEHPDRGEIAINGRCVAGSCPFVPPNHRQVGMVFQSYALFPHLTVEKNIAYGLPRSADRAGRVAEMLELVGLSGLGRRFPQELSGGQQQRVALARALAPQPDTLLLDEPFSNLDIALRIQVREDVQRIILNAGVSAILVTHDQDEAMSMADQVGMMFDGRIVQLAAPRTLYEHPVSPRVAHFLGEANIVPGLADGPVAHTPLGTVQLREPRTGPVEILIRPEDLLLNSVAHGTPAEINRSLYYGPRQSVWLTLADGTTLKAVSGTDQVFRAGDRAGVAVRGLVTAFEPERAAKSHLAGSAIQVT